MAVRTYTRSPHAITPIISDEVVPMGYVTGGFVPLARTLTAGAGLTGGGDLSANRTFDVVANADASIAVNANDIQVGVLASDTQHGARGGGTQHAAATGTVNGFMSSAHFSKLDAYGSALGLEGNLIVVDVVNGSDATGARGRRDKPFATLQAALTAALSGDSIWLAAGAHTLTAGITIPNGVIIRGMAFQNTIVQMLNVTADTNLVTMGDGCVLFDIGLKLTSAQHHTLKGLVFPGTTNSTSRCNNINIVVDNSGAGAGNSNVYGVHISATAASDHVNDCLRMSRGKVTSTGTGTKRGILADGDGGQSSSRGTNFVCIGGGGGSFIAAETNHANARLDLELGNCEGTTSDVSNTLGTLELEGVGLVNNTCNSLNFTARNSTYGRTFCDLGAVPAGTRYMYPGTENVSTNEPSIRLSSPRIAKALSVRARIAPGGANTDVYTVRKNGADTALTVNLTGAATAASNTTNAVSFTTGDLLGVKIVTAGGSATQDVAVDVEVY